MQCLQLLLGVFHRGRCSQHDDRAVIHRVSKNRACEHKPVENGHCDANRDAIVHVKQHSARRCTEDVHIVVVASVAGRSYKWLPVDDKCTMPLEAYVENLLRLSTIT